MRQHIIMKRTVFFICMDFSLSNFVLLLIITEWFLVVKLFILFFAWLIYLVDIRGCFEGGLDFAPLTGYR